LVYTQTSDAIFIAPSAISRADIVVLCRTSARAADSA
jgi:hypothetical protein